MKRLFFVKNNHRFYSKKSFRNGFGKEVSSSVPSSLSSSWTSSGGIDYNKNYSRNKDKKKNMFELGKYPCLLIDQGSFKNKKFMISLANYSSSTKDKDTSSSTSRKIISSEEETTSSDDDKEKDNKSDAKQEDESKLNVNETFSKIANGIKNSMGSIKDRIQEIFEADSTSWNDAFRELFGQSSEKERRRRSRKSASTDKDEVEEWYEAVDEETGKKYYYTASGETRWADETNAADDEIKTGKTGKTGNPDVSTNKDDPDPEKFTEETSDFEKIKNARSKPSFLEKKLGELTHQLTQLEAERESAMEASDMKTYKELNSKVRAIRKEIQNISAKMNSSAMVTVEEEKSTWNRFSESIRETPLLRGIFGIGDTETVKKAKMAAEDAREVWETSQNPWIYRAHALWDSLFSETEMGETVRELRKLDPEFTVEGLMKECEEDIIPTVLLAFLRGDEVTVDEYCSEAAAAAIKSSIQERKKAGRKMDPHLLGVEDATVVKMQVVEKMGPIVVFQAMAQQVDCLYDMNGKVVEGKEDNIVGVYYAFAMNPADDENESPVHEDGSIRWKVKEFMLVGKIPYI